MIARAALRLFRDDRGVSLVDTVIAGMIFVAILMGLVGMYSSSEQAYNYGTAQAYLQRVGTLMQERIQRDLLSAISLQTVNCGPNVTAQQSVLYVTQGAGGGGAGTSQKVYCMFQNTVSTPPGPQIYRCQVTNFAVGDPCQGGTTENMLTFVQSQITNQVNAPLQVSNVIFHRVTCLPASSGSCGDPGRQVLTPLVDVRFDLTDNINFNEQAGINGIRFAMSLTPRN